MSHDVDWSGFLIRAEQAQRRAEEHLSRNRVRDAVAELRRARDEMEGALVWIAENVDPAELVT